MPSALGFSLAGTFAFELNTTKTRVSSAAGVTLNPPLPDRLNPTDPATNAWAKVTITNGTLNVLGLTVTGGLEIAISSANELRMRANNVTARMAVAGLTVAQGTANATFLIRSDGLAGKASLTGTSQPDSTLLFGWQAGTTFEAEFKTLPDPINVPFGESTARLSGPAFARIFASGGIVAQNLTLTGTFGLSASGSEVAIAGGNLQASLLAGNTAVFALGPISAALGVRNTSLAARLAMTLAAGPPSTLGFAFTGAAGLRLEINTANKQIPSIAGVTLAVPLTQGRYARVVVTGNLTANGLTATGQMTFTAGASFVAVTGEVGINIAVGGTTVLATSGAANWIIASNGIAGRSTLTVNASVPATLNFSLSGTFTFEVNTTRANVSSLGGLSFSPPLPDRLNPTDTVTNASTPGRRSPCKATSLSASPQPTCFASPARRIWPSAITSCKCQSMAPPTGSRHNSRPAFR